ncbi:MAG: DUF4013 domain-containing protein [Ignavibacteria bacterium]|nr:DUF4013 domain-containing protein [Ignavibacteria bacterium]
MNDLGKAFSFPFKDPEWVSKFLLAAVFMVLSIVLIGIFILAGYLVQVAQRVMRREENCLPAWDDIGVKLVVGFKYCVVHLIYVLPIVLIWIPLVVLMMISGIAEPDAAEALAGLGIFAWIIGMLVIIPYSLLLTAVTPIIMIRFAENERIADALDVGEIWRFFRRNWQNTCIIALIAVGLQSFAGVGLILFIVGIFFTVFYAYLVSAYLYGTLYHEQKAEGVAVR